MIYPGGRFMGIAAKLLGRMAVWAALGIMIFAVTGAGAEPSADSRLIFDPGALDRSHWGWDQDGSQRAATRPADEAPAQASEHIWIPDTFKLPSFEDKSLVSGSLAQGLSSAKNQSAPVGANLLEQRVTPGGLSIGLETETTIKQRSLSGDGDQDPQRDIILDPKRQRGFLPFIGLSAKSSLQ